MAKSFTVDPVDKMFKKIIGQPVVHDTQEVQEVTPTTNTQEVQEVEQNKKPVKEDADKTTYVNGQAQLVVRNTQHVQEVQHTQEVQEVQEVKRAYNTTQGRAGQKLPRINMAFSPENLEYLRVMAAANGVSITAYVNGLVAIDREEHLHTYEAATSIMKGAKR